VPDSAVPTFSERKGPGPWPAPRGDDARGRVYRARAFHRRRDVVKITAASVATVVLVVVGQAQHATPAVAGVAGLPAGASPVAPGAFAPGACIAFAPLTSRARASVFLDPGAGGADLGVVGRDDTGEQVSEASATLPAVLDAVPLLRRAGYRVVVSRLTAGAVAPRRPAGVGSAAATPAGSRADSRARARCADDAHASVLVSLQYGSGATLTQAGALSAWDPARPFASRNERLAAVLLSSVRSALRARGTVVPRLGVVPDTPGSAPELAAVPSSHGHLLILGPRAVVSGRPTGMPGAVIVPLLLTNPYEASLAQQRSTQHALGAGIAEGIERFLRSAA
jgi:N-acetylmuramoyl-L-alanine amidase